MNDVLISFETAKLAKEKGFYQKDIDDHYLSNGQLSTNPYLDSINGKSFGSAPTQSLLQKWLREKGIIIVPLYGYNDNPNWSVHVEVVEWMVENKNSVLISGIDFEPGLYETYEDALEKGLQEGLKLVKI